MEEKRFDYQFEMENFFGDVLVLYGYDDGKAFVLMDTGDWVKVKEFPNYDRAYSFAYARGYIE